MSDEKYYLNKNRMISLYSTYLESSDVCDFSVWLKRHFCLSEYQCKRMERFRGSACAKQVLDSHAWD